MDSTTKRLLTERRLVRGDGGALAEILSEDMNRGRVPKRNVVAAATLGHPVAQRVAGVGTFGDPQHALLAIDDSWILADVVMACVRLVESSLLRAPEAFAVPWKGAILFEDVSRFVERRDSLRWEDPANQGKGDRGLVQDAIRSLLHRIRGDYGSPKRRLNAVVVLESMAMCCSLTFHSKTEPERRAWIVRECAEAAARIATEAGEGMYDPAEGDLMALEVASSRFVAPATSARFVGWSDSSQANLTEGRRMACLGQRLALLEPEGAEGAEERRFSAWLPLACFKVAPGLCASSGVSRVMAEAVLPGYVAPMR